MEREMSSNLCRLCDKESEDMHNIFGRSTNGLDVLELIKNLLPVVIYRNDPLPKLICDDCFLNLYNFSDFRSNSLLVYERHKERLREKISDHNVRSYLDKVDNEIENHVNQNENDSSSYEVELCDELQKAIKDSLKQNKLKESLQHAEMNGDSSKKNSLYDLNGAINIGDDDSRQSFYNSGISNRSDSQSDMELCDSDVEQAPKVATVNVRGKRVHINPSPIPKPVKKRRLVGPKPLQQLLRRKYEELISRDFGKKEVTIYRPFSLLRCALNAINKIIVPDFEDETCEKRIGLFNLSTESPADERLPNRFFYDDDDRFSTENYCRQCDTPFPNNELLATHECRHMFVVLGDKVDSSRFKPDAPGDMFVRSKWLKTLAYSTNILRHYGNHERDFSSAADSDDSDMNEISSFYPESDEDNQNLLVPVGETDNKARIKGEVVLIDTKATVNGVLLADIPKDDRRLLYKSVTVSGVKRKFCPLCRYTFKDNWAIESHYFTTSCHYTCRFCGIRFNKQRHEFDPHVRQHIMNGDDHSTKIFSSRKFQTIPRAINEDRMEPVNGDSPRSESPASFSKPQSVDESYNSFESPVAEVKSEYKPQNQAYFCRKCYQVFYQLNEFDVHAARCTGTKPNQGNSYSQYHNKFGPHVSLTVKNVRQRPTSSSGSTTSDNESFSPTGRPRRHCVKEVGTYVEGEDPDDLEESYVGKEPTPGQQRSRFECTMCSSCFPTVHSRNSHMRIHKTGLHNLNPKSISITKHKPIPLNKSPDPRIPTFAKYVNNVKIKQEPMEPIVEIHEHSDYTNIPSNIGSVSITPLPNSKKTSLDPSIMELVQNNPNLTIKSVSDKKFTSPRPAPAPPTPPIIQEIDTSKCYRCSSCSKPFANKSDLYFHKKNQCSGSRYPCPFCKRRFGSEAAYSSHIFYNHPE